MLDDYEFLLRVGSTGRIEFLSSITAESRSFTGKPGIQNHIVREARHIGRCIAGIQWLHKDLYSSKERKQEARALRLNTKRFLAGNSSADGKFCRLLLRARTTGDLLVWWAGYSLPHKLKTAREGWLTVARNTYRVVD